MPHFLCGNDLHALKVARLVECFSLKLRKYEHKRPAMQDTTGATLFHSNLGALFLAFV